MVAAHLDFDALHKQLQTENRMVIPLATYNLEIRRHPEPPYWVYGKEGGSQTTPLYECGRFEPLGLLILSVFYKILSSDVQEPVKL